MSKRGKRGVFDDSLGFHARILCSNCGNEPQYLDTGWCEPCLWNLIKDDQEDSQPMAKGIALGPVEFEKYNDEQDE